MSHPVDRPTADRNLLFGVLALQMNFVSRDALVGGMHAWVLEKRKPLGQVLLEQGQLTSQQLQALDAVLAQHLAVHGDDPQRSMEAFPPDSSIESALSTIDDAEVRASLAHLGRAGPDEETRD